MKTIGYQYSDWVQTGANGCKILQIGRNKQKWVYTDPEILWAESRIRDTFKLRFISILCILIHLGSFRSNSTHLDTFHQKIQTHEKTNQVPIQLTCHIPPATFSSASP